MHIPDSIIKQQSDEIQRLFKKWQSYMAIHLEYNPSEIHFTDHTERVLLYILLIGNEILGSDEQLLLPVIHATLFHDTRRENDYLDVGHGYRGANYYKVYCKTNGLDFNPLAYQIIKYHDQDDEIGLSNIIESDDREKENKILLFKLFKDADALDRFRLGEKGLNLNFLRLEQSQRWVGFAEKLVSQTQTPAIKKRIAELIEEYKTSKYG